jgi:hypothetical protein
MYSAFPIAISPSGKINLAITTNLQFYGITCMNWVRDRARDPANPAAMPKG